MTDPWQIDRATRDDLPMLGTLGALLMRTHHQLDHDRFLAPGDDPEGGYAWFLAAQLDRDDARVLVARRGGAVHGYAYLALEPMSWNELRGPAGFVHDLVVHPDMRGQGAADALLDAALAWLRERGAPRAVLWTAEGNARAEHVFLRHGFRRTMTEMTREL